MDDSSFQNNHFSFLKRKYYSSPLNNYYVYEESRVCYFITGGSQQ